jgi:hypothetical protein
LHDPVTLSGAGMTEAEFAAELESLPPGVPSLEALLSLDYSPTGVYLCGCPWRGFFVPHFCPVHEGAFVVFEITDHPGS